LTIIKKVIDDNFRLKEKSRLGGDDDEKLMFKTNK